MSDTRSSVPWKAGAALAALLLAAACTAESGPGPEGEESPSADGAAAPLAGEGFLGLECGEGSVTVSRVSDEDGSVQATHTFTAADAVSARTPVLGAGRPVEMMRAVALPDCVTDQVGEYDYLAHHRNRAHELAGSVIPESSSLLVTVTENVQGTDAVTIGAMSSDGTVEALLPTGGDSEFSDAVHRISPQYNHLDGRIYYLELDEGSRERTVMSLDPESGATEVVEACDEGCGRVVVDPHSGHIYSAYPESFEDLPGGFMDDSGRLHPYDNMYFPRFSNRQGTVVGYFVNDLGGDLRARNLGQGDPAVSWMGRSDPQIVPTGDWSLERLGTRADERFPGQPVMMVGEYDILLDDEPFSVVSLDPETLRIGEAPTRTLLPGGGRDNGHPVLSADGSRVLFRSAADSGEASWYSVPVDGSGEPVEIGALPAEYPNMVPVLWNG
ncbi:hypothetical protein ACIBFB_05475 [Nocardiopsis sp. NPDC050513]|uniref:hypothetical protein n=1 Tax=Nocardiopsis sp. NPDC050513 TaxID=3364338 RepID=UPI0037A9EE9B